MESEFAFRVLVQIVCLNSHGYMSGSATPSDIHSKSTWYCGGQQRSPNRGGVRGNSGPVWTFISGSLQDKEPVDVRGEFD